MAVILVIVVLALAAFPPRTAPRWWRHVTRPLRRRLRPRRYHTW
jgi:hypothetical protein